MAIASARPSDVQKVDRTISYLLYIALMAQQSDADLKMTDLFTARALLVLEQAPVACIANLENDVVSAGLTRANALLPEFEKVLASTLPSRWLMLRVGAERGAVMVRGAEVLRWRTGVVACMGARAPGLARPKVWSGRADRTGSTGTIRPRRSE